MERSHLSVVLDLNPAQWYLAEADPSDPLTLAAFLSQLLAFLNAHIALKHENDLAVFAALPGKRSACPHSQFSVTHHSGIAFSSTPTRTRPPFSPTRMHIPPSSSSIRLSSPASPTSSTPTTLPITPWLSLEP